MFHASHRNKTIQYLSFCYWVISFKIMYRLLYIVTEDGLSLLAEAYSMCVRTTYPFISWWEFWLILYLSCYECCWNKHRRIDVCLTYWFYTFVSMPGSVITGLYACLDLSDKILKIFFKMCVVIFCKSIDFAYVLQIFITAISVAVRWYQIVLWFLFMRCHLSM